MRLRLIGGTRTVALELRGLPEDVMAELRGDEPQEQETSEQPVEE